MDCLHRIKGAVTRTPPATGLPDFISAELLEIRQRANLPLYRARARAATTMEPTTRFVGLGSGLAGSSIPATPGAANNTVTLVSFFLPGQGSSYSSEVIRARARARAGVHIRLLHLEIVRGVH